MAKTINLVKHLEKLDLSDKQLLAIKKATIGKASFPMHAIP